METENGGTNGKCMSGKDRKAMETMHTDAKIVESSRATEDEPVVDHRQVMGELFLTSHHERVSAENAKGSIGIKNISDVLGNGSTNIGAIITQRSHNGHLANSRQQEISRLERKISSIKKHLKDKNNSKVRVKKLKKQLSRLKKELALAQDPIKYSEKKASLNKISKDKLSDHLQTGAIPSKHFRSHNQTTKPPVQEMTTLVNHSAGVPSNSPSNAQILANEAAAALRQKSNTFTPSDGHKYQALPQEPNDTTDTLSHQTTTRPK